MATVNMDMLPATDQRNCETVSSDETDVQSAPRDLGDLAAEARGSSQATSLEVQHIGASLVRRHQSEIWRYLRFLGCQDAQADDVTQETFLAVLKKPPTSRDLAAVRAYLRSVARNTFLALLRKTSREAEFDLDAAERIWAESHPRDGGDQRLAALDDCLDQLEGRARQAIYLAYRDTKSRSDIAATLEMSEDGVKSLLRRTRDVLRQCVERKVSGSGDSS